MMTMITSEQDWVLVEGLVIDAMVGIYAFEHEQPQPLVFDVALAFENRPAAVSEAIADALDYDQVVELLQNLVASRSWQLIESIAEQAASQLLQRFAISEVRLKLAKPQAIPSARQAAVQICRRRAV